MHRRLWKYYKEVLPQEQYQIILNSAKITVFDGDLTCTQLGLADDTVSQLKACVNIYIHSACSISLTRPLSYLAKSIVEPSLELAEIALGSVCLEKFLYISTAYANSHLHHLHDGVDTKVSEEIYSLRSNGGDSTDLELGDLRKSGTTPEYQSHKFPFPYAYAKHLTERLLTKLFIRQGKSESLLIVRPSIIGPALRDPFPYYEIRGSAPATNVLAGFIGTPSMQFTLSSRFKNPLTESTLDEVPVDIVVNRILMHIYQRSEGCVHAVAGARGRHDFQIIWEKAMSERRLPWHPNLVWLDVDWHSPLLHSIARAFVIMGTSYLFEDVKVYHIWANMTDGEKAKFPLFVRAFEDVEDIVQRRHLIRHQMGKWLSRKGMPILILRLLIRGSSSGKGWN